MRSNTRARRAIERGEHTNPKRAHIGTYRIWVINNRRLPQPKVRQGYRHASLKDISYASLVKFLNTEGKKRLLFPVVTKKLMQQWGITAENSTVILYKDEIVGFGAIVDRRAIKQYRIVRMPKIVELLRTPWNSFARRFRYIGIPKLNTALACPVATLVCVKDDEPALFASIVSTLGRISQASSDIFMLALAETSPHTALVDTKYNFKLTNDLYCTSETMNIGGMAADLYVDALMLY